MSSSNTESDFEMGNADSSLSYPSQASSLKKGGYVLIKGCPCKIIELQTSKVGKHGHAKVTLSANDIFTGKRMEMTSPSTHNVQIPIIERHDYPFIGIENGYVSILLDNSKVRDDIKLPSDELGEKLLSLYEEDNEVIISVLESMNQIKIMDIKGAKH